MIPYLRPMASQDISLKDLIRAVSEELVASRAERLASHRQAIFEVSELTIDVSFVVTESAGGSGGFDLKILKADAKADYQKETVQRISLTLKTVQDQDAFTELGDEVPLRPRRGRKQ